MEILSPAFTKGLIGTFHVTRRFPGQKASRDHLGHQSVGIINFPGACFIYFSFFASSCLPKKKQEFSTIHFSRLSKQLNYSDKIPLIWTCLNKWNSGLPTSLRRTAKLLREFPIVLLTVLVPFFSFRGIWYNTTQLPILHIHSCF